MKKIFEVKDKFGGKIQVYILASNKIVKDDLIYFRAKRRKEKEIGFVINDNEAYLISHALILAGNHLQQRGKDKSPYLWGVNHGAVCRKCGKLVPEMAETSVGTNNPDGHTDTVPPKRIK